MKLIAIADTHGLHRSLEIPDGDVLIHAGDLTRHGTLDDVREFNDFLGTLPHSHKIVITGNHDFCFEKDREACEELLTNCIYLQDQEVIIDGIKFYGSPWQPWFYDWAFNLQRGPEIRAKWELIPKDTDVLITHGPPYGIGDVTFQKEHAGCEDLLEIVERTKPAVHIFGHIHEGYGITSNGTTTFINASSYNHNYQAINQPVIYGF
ncbi:MAG: metallophosphatase domain-containing protein [Candidatus Hodarchaeales archaeon]